MDTLFYCTGDKPIDELVMLAAIVARVSIYKACMGSWFKVKPDFSGPIRIYTCICHDCTATAKRLESISFSPMARVISAISQAVHVVGS